MIFQLKELLNRIGSDQEKGQTLIEYALIILLVSITVIIVLGLLGGQVQAVFEQIRLALGGAVPPPPPPP